MWSIWRRVGNWVRVAVGGLPCRHLLLITAIDYLRRRLWEEATYSCSSHTLRERGRKSEGELVGREEKGKEGLADHPPLRVAIILVVVFGDIFVQASLDMTDIVREIV